MKNHPETSCKICSTKYNAQDGDVKMCGKCTSCIMNNLIRFEKDSFAITQDHLNDEHANSLATVSRLKALGYTHHFRLYDDDDELYYSGYLYNEIEDEFEALDWGMADSGCTYTTIRNPSTGLYEHL